MANNCSHKFVLLTLASHCVCLSLFCPQRLFGQQGFELRPLGQDRGVAVQDPLPAVPQQNEQDDDPEINLSERANLNLQGIVRWLAEVRGFKVIDDGKLEGKASQIQFYPRTTRVSKDQMFELVQGILRSNDLALVRSDLDGFYRIVALADVRPYAITGDPQEIANAEFVTFVFKLKYITAQQADEYLRKTYSRNSNASDNSITPLPNRNILIVTDTAKRLRNIAKVISEIDVPSEEIQTVFYEVENLEAAELEKQLTDLLIDTTPQNEGNRNTQTPSEVRLKIKADLRTNRLILIGSKEQIERATSLIAKLDIALGLKFVQYQLRNIAASRIDELVKQSLAGLDEAAQARVYQSSVNQQTNQLLVTARQEIHDRIEKFVEQLDTEQSATDEQSPLRFYTLKNVKAADIVETLQSIEQRFLRSRQRDQQQSGRQVRGVATRDGFDLNGPNFLNRNAEGPIQLPPFFRDQNGNSVESLARDQANAVGQSGEFGSPALNDFAQLLDRSRSAGNIIPGDAKITIDENTNTLIVVAPPAVQKLYADLIKKLDVRRPQVLVEIFVVSVDASDNFSLGIEISGGDRDGDTRLFSFTSFGLSTITPETGALAQGIREGLNGTLVDPDVADVVLKALAEHRCARVVGAPKILVADNGTGVLSSISEIPFSSINATNTVNSTTFAGFAQAGTTITVSPQISDDDYLNLEFDVLVNDFGARDEGAEVPPRNTDQVTSQVRIPDGHTVIVGGLKRNRQSNSRTGVPFLENIPVISRLTSSESQDFETEKLFVFIKPIILRDDKFRDLQHLSKVDRRKARIKGRFPQSKPLLMR